jgi:hypothetical protein
LLSTPPRHPCGGPVVWNYNQESCRDVFLRQGRVLPGDPRFFRLIQQLLHNKQAESVQKRSAPPLSRMAGRRQPVSVEKAQME